MKPYWSIISIMAFVRLRGLPYGRDMTVTAWFPRSTGTLRPPCHIRPGFFLSTFYRTHWNIFVEIKRRLDTYIRINVGHQLLSCVGTVTEKLESDVGSLGVCRIVLARFLDRMPIVLRNCWFVNLIWLREC